MKKMFTLLGAVLLAVACSDDDPKEKPAPPVPEVIPATVELDRSEVMLPNAGGSVEVKVITNKEVWSWECPDGWLVVEQTADGLKVTAPANADDQPKTATVTVTAGEDDNTAQAGLTVSQNGGSLILEVTVPAGSTFILPITGEVDATIDWGDGKTETFKDVIDNLMVSPPSHVYRQEGTYNIKVSGVCRGMYSMLGFPDDVKSWITGVVQWGTTGLTTMRYALNGCPNLAFIPTDSDGSFAEVTDFYRAFSNCPALTEIPAGLFGYAKKAESFSSVLESCTGLTSLPEGLFAGCAASTTFSSALAYLNITSVPENTFEGCSAVTTYASVLSNCHMLRHVPEDLFADSPEAADFTYILRDCQSLEEIPEGLFASNTKAIAFSGAFTYGYSLTAIPEKLFANNPLAERFVFTFADCASIKEIPAALFDNNKVINDIHGAFKGCLSLTGESPYTTVDGKKVHLYERSKYPNLFVVFDDNRAKYEYCFEQCTGLSDYQLMLTTYPGWVKD